METGRPSSKRQVGFSLIEVLAVVIIVGVILSVTVLSITLVRDDRELRKEGRRFAALIEVTLDDATMQGRDFGVEVLRTGYRFVEFDAFTGLWADVPGDKLLRLRSMPDDIELELYLEEKRVLLDNEPAPFEDDQNSNTPAAREVYAPHLLIYSSGETTPFELHLWRDFDEQRIVLRGDAFGFVEFLNEENVNH